MTIMMIQDSISFVILSGWKNLNQKCLKYKKISLNVKSHSIRRIMEKNEWQQGIDRCIK